MIIAVDFDGTLCTDKWKEIGEANINLINHLKLCKSNYGDKLILWTCRTGKLLDDAVKWCEEQGLIFDAVNENLPEVIEEMGGDTRKIFADVYIDDKALGENTGYWYKQNYLVTLNQRRKIIADSLEEV